MRVIVTGVSGVNKIKYLEKVQEICESDEANFGFVCIDEKIQKNSNIDGIISLENWLCKEHGYKSPHYLDLPEDRLRNDLDNSLKSIISKTKNWKNIILEMHTVYRRGSSYRNLINWETLRSFNPEMIICLIDDVYKIKGEIKNRTLRLPNESEYLTLKDIIDWREAESMTAKNMADNLFSEKKIPFFLLAIGHHPVVLYQLMFESHYALGENGKKTVYAGFPITIIKEGKPIVDEEETILFKKKISKYLIVFDPITIGEKKLHYKFKENMCLNNPKDYIKLEEEENSYVFSVNDLFPIIKDINNQIITRDERMIDQTDMLISYRPSHSFGAKHEVDHAKKSGKKPAFGIVFSEDPPSPFITEALTAAYNSIDELLHDFHKRGIIGGGEK